MPFNPRQSKKLVLSTAQIVAVAKDYQKMLSVIDKPVFRNKDRNVQGMYHAQVNAVRSLMVNLIGQEAWDDTCTVAGWEQSYLALEKEAEQIPLGSDILALPWE